MATLYAEVRPQERMFVMLRRAERRPKIRSVR